MVYPFCPTTSRQFDSIRFLSHTKTHQCCTLLHYNFRTLKALKVCTGDCSTEIQGKLHESGENQNISKERSTFVFHLRFCVSEIQLAFNRASQQPRPILMGFSVAFLFFTPPPTISPTPKRYDARKYTKRTAENSCCSVYLT